MRFFTFIDYIDNYRGLYRELDRERSADKEGRKIGPVKEEKERRKAVKKEGER